MRKLIAIMLLAASSVVFAQTKIPGTFTGTKTFSGISFGDETLSVYDEGTWSPTLSFATSNGTTSSLTVVNARYIRIGNNVNVFTNLTVTKGDASGQLRIAGLPFASTYNVTCTTQSYLGQLSLSAGQVVVASINAGAARLDFYDITLATGGASTFLPSELNTGAAGFVISCVYFI